MAKRSVRSKSSSLSPIDPSMHFILFLILALLLVVAVAGVLQKTSQQTRAFLRCFKPDAVKLSEKLIQDCTYGVTTVTDKDGCPVVQCNLVPDQSVRPRPLPSQAPTLPKAKTR